MNKLSVAALASSLLMLTGRSVEAQTARARIADTPIRSEATLTAAVIATVKEGDPIDVVDMQGDWYRVLVPDAQGKPRVGYVMAWLIETANTAESPRATPALAQGPPTPPTPALAQGPPVPPTPALAQGPPIPPTLAQLQRDRTKEQALKAQVDAAAARLEALKNGSTNSDAGERQVPPPLPATSQTREGFWFNGGLGFGSLGCVNCDGHVSGASGGLSLGGTINDKVILGVGTTGWYRSKDGVALNAGTLDARVRFYPSLTSGFFLTGGLGLGTISVGLNGYGSNSETGVGLVLGVGWDVRIRQNLSLTPFWNGSAVRTSNADANFGQFGLGITIH